MEITLNITGATPAELVAIGNVLSGQPAVQVTRVEPDSEQAKEPAATGCRLVPAESEDKPVKVTTYTAPEPEPAAPAAPEATPEPAAPEVTGAELDAEGLPWDGRIHGSGKTKYEKTTPNGKAGTWKLKRGVDKAFVAQVKAELLAARAQSVPTPPAAPAAAPAPAAPAAAPAPAPAPAAPAAPAPAPAEPEVETRPALTYGAICQRVTAAVSEGKLDPIATGTMLAGCGLSGGLPELETRPDLWAVVNSKLDEMLS